jgi:hypothetical protein
MKNGMVTAVTTIKTRCTAGPTIQSPPLPGESHECAPKVCDGTAAYAVANSGGSTAKVGPKKAKGKPSAEAVGLCEDPELGSTGCSMRRGQRWCPGLTLFAQVLGDLVAIQWGEQPAKIKPIKAGSAQHAEKPLFVVHLF